MLDEIRKGLPEKVRAQLAPQITNLELVWRLNKKDQDALLKVALRLEQELQSPKAKAISLTNKLYFDFNLGLAFFLCKQFSQSSAHFQNIWEKRKRSSNPNVYKAPIWEMIVLFEQESMDLERRYKSVLAFCKTLEHLPPLTIPVIHLIHRVYTKALTDRQAEWQKFKEMHAESWEAPENLPLRDSLAWITSKAEGKETFNGSPE